MKKIIKKGGGNISQIRPKTHIHAHAQVQAQPQPHIHTHAHIHKSKPFGEAIIKPIKSIVNKYFKTIIIFIIILGLSIGGYFLYKNIQTIKDGLFSSKLLLGSVHDGKISKIILNNEFPRTTSSNEYNMSLWIYINDYNYRKSMDKCILFRGSLKGEIPKWNRSGGTKSNISNPSIWLLSNNNTLRIYTGLDTSYKNVKNDYCEIKYAPLQKWIHLNICFLKF